MSDKEKTKHFKILGFDFAIVWSTFLSYTLKVWLVLGIILAISIVFFNYQMTTSDIPGGLISGALLGYLIHIIRDL